MFGGERKHIIWKKSCKKRKKQRRPKINANSSDEFVDRLRLMINKEE